MGGILGRSHRSKVTEQDRAVLQLKQQRDKLSQYTRRLGNQLERERQLAKKLISSGKKDKVLLLLKKKRCLEKLIEQANGQMSNVQQLINEVEFAQVEVQVFNGLKAGNQALKELHQLMSLDDVERILDDTRDSIAYQEEINEAIAGTLTPKDTRAAEQELEDLLRSLDQELPNVPTDEIVHERDRELERHARKQRPTEKPMMAS